MLIRMPKIRNVSPYGDLDVPLLGQVVEANALVEVTNEQARVLLRQHDNWQPHEPAKGEKSGDKS